jgi:chromosome segregation ATPase
MHKRSWEEVMQSRTAVKPRRSKKQKEVVEQKADEAPTDPAPAAVMPLISVEDGQYILNEEAATWLEQLPGPFGTVAVAGKYRTGKSFFLNRVLLQKEVGDTSGFGVGPTTQAHTKGLWISPQLLQCKGQPTLIIDTEGIAALDANSTHDTRIFCLALLLSSFFIYNSVGTIDEEALNTLSLVVKVAEQIRKSDRNQSPTQEMFPSFLWIVRDFALRLRDVNNNPITEAEYLEGALKETGDPGSDKNKIRKCLKDFFSNRSCATLVRPCESEDQLQDLDTTPNSGLRDVFVQQITRLRADIFQQVKPKTACGQPLSGKLFVQMCRSFTEAINKGAAPSIRNTWSMLSQGQCIAAMENALQVFKGRAVFSALPVQQDTLIDVLRMAREVANAEYQVKAFGDEMPLYASKLQDAIDQEENVLKDKNKAALTRVITSNFEALSLSVENASSFEKFKKQYDGAKDTFLGKYPGYQGYWAEGALDFVWTAASSYINQSQRRILKELEDASLAAAAARRESHNSVEELQQLRAANATLTQENSALQGKVQDLSVQLEGKQEALTQSESLVEQLQQRLVETESTLTGRLQEQQEAFTKQLQELQSSVREQMEAACSRSSSLEGQVLDLELRLSDTERQLEQKREEAEVLTEKCCRLEAEVEAGSLLAQQKEELEAEKEGLEESLEELQAELETTVQAAEAEQKQFRETAIQSMEEMKAAQIAERETFKSKLAKLSKTHESALEDVRSKVAILEQQTLLGERQVARKNDEIAGLQEQLQSVIQVKDNLVQAAKQLEVRHAEALAAAERQYQQGIQSLRAEVTGLHDTNTRECLGLMEQVRAAESRAVLAETRLRDIGRQLEAARNNDGPKIAALQTSVKDLTVQLQRAQADVSHLRESKEDLNRRLKEATANIKVLTNKCRELGTQAEKEVAAVRLTYEKRISVLEQRLAEIL